MPNTVVIASTTWWSFPARLAIAFSEIGWRVEAICPAGHPLRFSHAVEALHNYRAMRPHRSLRRALKRARPDLVIPCDDRCVAHLHALYRQSVAVDDPGAEVIRRSLGNPVFYGASEHRAEIMDIALELGIRVAMTRSISRAGDIEAAATELGLPAVVKLDGTWGGMGVAMAHSIDRAKAQAMHMSRQPTLGLALKRLLVDRDPFWLHGWLHRSDARVTLQRHVVGRPANSLLACWQGKVMASIQVEVVCAQHEMGASTIVRVIDHADMTFAGQRLVDKLGLSGYCGLDFIIEESTGEAHLIEMNKRATPLAHFALGPQRDLVTAVATEAAAQMVDPRPVVTINNVLAFFPEAWRLDPGSPYLQTAFHDVPWSDPRLVQELMRKPWPSRSLAACCKEVFRRSVAAWQDPFRRRLFRINRGKKYDQAVFDTRNAFSCTPEFATQGPPSVTEEEPGDLRPS